MAERRRNRKHRIARRSGLGRLWAGRANRRVAARQIAQSAVPRQAATEVAEQRNATRRAQRRRVLAVSKKAFGVAAVVLGLGVVGYFGYRWIVRASLFDIAALRLHDNRRVSPAEVKPIVDSVIGQLIFRVDTKRLAHALKSHPWIADVRIRRELPDVLHVSLIEQDPVAALALDALYLVNPAGDVFKRAEGSEARGLPVITGVSRVDYLKHPRSTHKRIRQALDAMSVYRKQNRPTLGEVNLGSEGELSLLLRQGGAALRFGKRFGQRQLQRFDAVLAVLGPDAERLRAVYLDHQARPDRVVVRLNSLQAQSSVQAVR